jgi:hypothetical protein
MPLMAALVRYLPHLVAMLCGYLAVTAIRDQSWEELYASLGLALAAHAVDIWLTAVQSRSRSSYTPTEPIAAVVSQQALWFTLEVVVPVFALIHAGFLVGLAGVVMAVLIASIAVYRIAFCPTPPGAPSTIGLPALWSIVAFGLHAFDATPIAAVLVIGLVLILNLVPWQWPHVLFVERWSLQIKAAGCVAVCVTALTLVRGLPAEQPARTILTALAGVFIAWAINANQPPPRASRPRR